MNKIVVVLILSALIIACAGRNASTAGTSTDGATLYKKYCNICHGADGKLALNGAKDITISELTEAERVELIKSGKNTMMPFGSILSAEEIMAVAAYSMTLKQ
jgi:mono/diheme cytochrome c family protein